MKLFLRFCIFLFSSYTLFAQGVTTGSMHGTVVSPTGNLAGATVIAIHKPSGTKFGAVVRSNGQYNIRGMRVGGPYTVTASFIGFKTQSKENINVGLGQDVEVSFSLKEEVSTTEEVVITAEKSNILNASKTGSGSTISEEEIAAAPTINRSIGDIARVNPLATESNSSNSDGLAGISIGGQNTRFNNFQIDGAVANDMFGIGGSGTAGSQANSNFISLDAIQELQVSVSPYDVRQSGFTGGIINAITRGGTNKFTGSAFLFGRNQDFVGRSPDANRLQYSDFSDFQFGGRIGGPIIENELFFHITAERRQRRNPLDVGLNDPNSLVNFRSPKSELEDIIEIARDVYGYDAGTADPFTIRNNSTNIIGRLDWNISDLHRLQFRHNFTDAFQDRNVLRDNNDYSLTSQWNEFGSLTNSSVLQLNSIVDTDISNEFRISYTSISDERRLQAGQFPAMRIAASGGNVYLGPQRDSQKNALDQDQIAITNDLTMFFGEHTVTIGTHNEIYRFNNLFIQSAFGSYNFANIEDFKAQTPSFYEVNYANLAATGGDPNPRAKWSMMQNGLYVQDDWNVFKNFRVNLGIRGDLPIYFDEPTNNPLFSRKFDSLAAIYSALPDSLKALRTEIKSGLSTSKLPNSGISDILWSPRVGFNWDISGDRTFQLRGGTGLFTGRVATVWISNQYSNTGVDIFNAQLGSTGGSSPIIDPATGLPLVFKNFDPNNPPRPGDGFFPGNIQTAAINITDENFTMPQVWRSTVGIDFEITPGITATIEGMYSRQINQVDYANINLHRRESMPVSPVDGRPLYSGAPATNGTRNAQEFTDVIVLKSRSEGYQYSILSQLVLKPDNPFLKGLSATLAYTNSATYDLNAGTNSTARSQWQGTSITDPNNTAIGRSNFDVPHRFLANLSYRLDVVKNFPTTFGIYYSGNSGRPYSLIYGRGTTGQDANYDGIGFNDLIYVPNREDLGTKIVMEPEGNTDLRTQDEIWEQFMSYIDANSALKDFRGRIIERNSARAPWINQLDFRLSQSVPSFGGQSIEFTLDVQNLLNLLNPDWGHQLYMTNPNTGVVGFLGYEASGLKRMRLTFSDPAPFLTADTFYSRWRMQLGMRYNF